MANVRIRWRGVGRAAAIVVVALIAIRVVPGLLRAPQPPPLGRDVGLPKAGAAPVEPVREITGHPARKLGRTKVRPHRRSRRKVPTRTAPDTPASHAVIGSRRRHRSPSPKKPRHHRGAADHGSSSSEATDAAAADRVASPPPAVPEYVAPAPPEAPPPSAPEPTPVPPPEPAPAPPTTPDDGSQEFAPH